MDQPILELRHITKKFPGVVALDDVSLSFAPGEVHAIVGENGAGKSTFIKIITGAYQPTSGEIVFEGKKLEKNSPIISMGLGISAIYQEFNLFPALTVAENVFYGRFPKSLGFVDYRKMREDTVKVMERLGMEISPDAIVKDLSIGYQQIIEIAKAVSSNARLMIMDEPSAPLSENEVDHLFKIIHVLKAQGITVIYISHRLEEIFEVCDRVSVFRDGKYISTSEVSQTDAGSLIRTMVNRDLSEQYPDHSSNRRGKKVLEIRHLSTSKLKDINLEAYEGEILGLAGLVGAGRTEIARALFGADPRQSGTFLIDGKEVKISHPFDAIEAGIGLIPEDRKGQGLLLNESVRRNISFANFAGITPHVFISEAQDREIAKRYIDMLAIKTPSAEQTVSNLSGGNQQKVVLAKWLFTKCKVLIFDEPTRGIDVGAKQEIYNLMLSLVAEGKVIIMISSDMLEMIGMSDRVLVMHEGKIGGSLEGDQITQENIMTIASGLENEAATP